MKSIQGMVAQYFIMHNYFKIYYFIDRFNLKELSNIKKKINIIFRDYTRKIQLNEITTYFRVYSVELLKKLPFDELNAQGYSLGVKLVWLMKKLNADLIEIPIHFKDRNKGKSKLPKNQILISVFDLFKLKLIDIFNINIFKND